MRILLSNDDGVYAPGLRSLYEELKDIADVTVVAPLEERSATGQTLTLDHPLRLAQIEENIYGLSGFPADCVLFALSHLLKDSRPDLVISGINRGANLGQDVYYSGTVAAARQAIFNNVPAIAVSTNLDYNDHERKPFYSSAAKFIKNFLKDDEYKSIQKNTLLNINVPDLETEQIEGVEITNLGFRHYTEDVKHRFDFKNREYYWIGGRYDGHCNTPGSDCNALDSRKISVTPLNVLKHSSDELRHWEGVFANWNTQD